MGAEWFEAILIWMFLIGCLVGGGIIAFSQCRQRLARRKND
jgi:hypothetical protein